MGKYVHALLMVAGLQIMVVGGFVACGAPDPAETPDPSEAATEDVPPIVPSQADDCEKVEGWVDAHAEALPDTVEGLKTLPSQYRRAIFNVMDPSKQSALVLEEIDHYRRTTLLTRAERDVLEDAFVTLGPEAYSYEPGEATLVTTAAFEERALAVFGDRFQREVLTILRSGRYENTDMVMPFCKCNTLLNDCGLEGGKCKAGEIKCNGTWRGCGYTFLKPCNGICIR